MTKIVVGVDGSDHGAVALRWAEREARLREGELVAVLAWDLFNQTHADGSRRFDPDYDESSADAALLAVLESTLGADAAASVTRRPICDLPAKALLDEAQDADLLVVGARGLGGFRGLLLGSVSQQCLHHATGPIAIIRSEEGDAAEPAAGGERIVVAVDGSPSSRRALHWAVVDGGLRSATVEAVHAWDVPTAYGPVMGAIPYDTSDIEGAARTLLTEVVDEAVTATGATDVTVERTLVPGSAASGVLDIAKGADLVVIGRRGVGGFERLMLGSVSENVARHAPCPVVVMPPERGTRSRG